MWKIRDHLKEYLLVFLLLVNVFIWYAIHENDNNKLLVYFLNIGQGDSVFIQSPVGNQMIIDGGPGSTVLQELSKILPFYDKKIDVVLSTHPDKDHMNGLTDVLKHFDVDYEIDPNVKSDTTVFKNFEQSLLKKSTKHFIAKRGMIVNLGGGVRFFVLFPDRDASLFETNIASVVGKLIYKDISFMFTGDSPKQIENYLTFLDSKTLESDVLKVGHHGSKTSSDTSFIKEVDPKFAVIQAGKNNSYGHPNVEVLDILKAQDVEILGNYDLGSILIESDGTNLNVVIY